MRTIRGLGTTRVLVAGFSMLGVIPFVLLALPLYASSFGANRPISFMYLYGERPWDAWPGIILLPVILWCEVMFWIGVIPVTLLISARLATGDEIASVREKVVVLLVPAVVIALNVLSLGMIADFLKVLVD